VPEKILIAVAWPYANAEIHAGNITGTHLPGDIVARYHRLKGNDVLMVSGTDAHGTPVMLAADKEGKPVEQVYARFHEQFLEVFLGYGITFDLFTSTHTQNHFKVAQSMFLALLQNGHLFKRYSKQWFSPSAGRFLPDRYVEGTCYICGFEGARSDQCDNCGNVLEPEKLIQPHSKAAGSLELRDTEHFYLDLSKLEPAVKSFLSERAAYMRDTVLGESLRKIESEGLKPRSITRDLDWGIPVPVEGWGGKCLYVWIEAVVGYLSAAIEESMLATRDSGSAGETENRWREWWTNPASRHYYFLGKDNIFFHTSMWPAELMGAGSQFLEIFQKAIGRSADGAEPLTLPYDVPANQFMNLEGQKISGSRNWGVWALDALTRYDADALRYYLTINMPENKDSDWNWEEFVARNNNELVATWGNLANRVLAFSFRHWEGRVPSLDLKDLRASDLSLIDYVDGGFETVGRELEAIHLRAALQEALRLAGVVNQYLDQTAPWSAIKADRTDAALSIYTALRAIDALKVLFSPFLPFSSVKLHHYLGYDSAFFGDQYTQVVSDSLGQHTVLRYREPASASVAWAPTELRPGQALRQPAALFKKLDAAIVEDERSRLRRLGVA